MNTAASIPSVHYPAVSRVLHWLTVLLIIGMFYTGFTGFGKPHGAKGHQEGPSGAIVMKSTPDHTAVTGPDLIGKAGVGIPGDKTKDMPPHGRPPQKPFAKTSLHKAMGFTILLLLVARILYRIVNRDRIPKLLATMPVWQIRAAHSVQGLIYVALIVQPLTGWLGNGHTFSYFGLFTLPAATFLNHSAASALMYIHTHLVWVLIGLIGLHVSGALYHHYVLKDNVLMSMARGQ